MEKIYANTIVDILLMEVVYGYRNKPFECII